MYSFRLQFAVLFHDLPLAHKIAVNQTGAFNSSQACSEDVFKFSRQTNNFYHLISELMDVFCIASVHQQPEQPNNLAGGQTLSCKLMSLKHALNATGTVCKKKGKSSYIA